MYVHDEGMFLIYARKYVHMYVNLLHICNANVCCVALKCVSITIHIPDTITSRSLVPIPDTIPSRSSVPIPDTIT